MRPFTSEAPLYSYPPQQNTITRDPKIMFTNPTRPHECNQNVIKTKECQKTHGGKHRSEHMRRPIQGASQRTRSQFNPIIQLPMMIKCNIDHTLGERLHSLTSREEVVIASCLASLRPKDLATAVRDSPKQTPSVTQNRTRVCAAITTIFSNTFITSLTDVNVFWSSSGNTRGRTGFSRLRIG